MNTIGEEAILDPQTGISRRIINNKLYFYSFMDRIKFHLMKIFHISYQETVFIATIKMHWTSMNSEITCDELMVIYKSWNPHTQQIFKIYGYSPRQEKTILFNIDAYEQDKSLIQIN